MRGASHSPAPTQVPFASSLAFLGGHYSTSGSSVTSRLALCLLCFISAFSTSTTTSFLRAHPLKESLTHGHTSLSVKNNREGNAVGVFPFSVPCELVSAAQWKPRFPSPSPPAVEGGPWLRDGTPWPAGAGAACGRRAGAWLVHAAGYRGQVRSGRDSSREPLPFSGESQSCFGGTRSPQTCSVPLHPGHLDNSEPVCLRSGL